MEEEKGEKCCTGEILRDGFWLDTPDNNSILLENDFLKKEIPYWTLFEIAKKKYNEEVL